MHQLGVSHPVADAVECHRLLQNWRTQCCKLWILPSPELTHTQHSSHLTSSRCTMDKLGVASFRLTKFSKVDRFNVQIIIFGWFLVLWTKKVKYYSHMVDNILDWHPARIQELSYSAHHRTKWNKPDSKKHTTPMSAQPKVYGDDVKHHHKLWAWHPLNSDAFDTSLMLLISFHKCICGDQDKITKSNKFSHHL